METKHRLYIFALFLSLLAASTCVRANCANKPGDRIMIRATPVSFADTIPLGNTAASNEKQPANVAEKTAATAPASGTVSINKETVIKTVPRSRRQAKPKVVAPVIDVKTLPAIKPKIIRTLPRL